MSAFNPAAIRTAIREVIEGNKVLPVRSVPTGVFGWGSFSGQPLEAQQALACETRLFRNRFDVRLDSGRDHPSTAFSMTGNTRRETIAISIETITHLESTVQEDERDDILAQAVADLGYIYEAVTLPGALNTTADSTQTGIVSGCLVGQNGSGRPERSWSSDWNQQLFRGRVAAAAIVQITQEV